MGVISNIRALLAGRRTTYTYDGGALAASVEGMGAEALYDTQPALRTVVDFLARNVAELPLKVYRTTDGGRVRDTSCAMASLLAEPNPDMTSYELVRDLVSDLKLYGFALWLVGRDADSPSGWQVRPIPPAWVSGWGGSSGFASDTVTFVDRHGGSRVTVSRESFVLFHGWCPGDPRRGSPAVRALRDTLREQASALNFRRDVWERGLRINGYLTRPPTVAPWADAQRERFLESLRSAWGRGGARSGGTPLFEDGIEYRPVEFNAREKDWASGVRLSREDVAAAFHVNPALIWPGDGQTYASARDNARALYADTLAPDLTFIARRVTKELRRIVGADAGTYAEFDLQAKLQGSFEEQAASLQSAVGAPWMTREEARDRMNLPRIDGTDLIVTPLNVLEGGLASPRDTDPTVERYRSAEPPAKGAPPRAPSPAPSHKAAPTERDERSLADALSSFFARQRRSVLAAMGASASKAAADHDGDPDGDPDWWDAPRWDDELADDLLEAALAASGDSARRALAELGLDPGAYDAEKSRGFVGSLVAARARMVNAATLRELEASLGPGDGGPAQVFDRAESTRAEAAGRTLATTLAAWGAVEAARQCAPRRTVKTWVTGENPRESHAAMDGQTVPVSARFSNGADWPGDRDALDAADVANCNCTVVLTVSG